VWWRHLPIARRLTIDALHSLLADLEFDSWPDHSMTLQIDTVAFLPDVCCKAALLNRWGAKLFQLGREMFQDNAIITPGHEF